MSPWILIARAAVGLIPSLVLIVFAGIIMLIGLALTEKRREYALSASDHLTDLAYAIVGATRNSTDSTA